MKQRLVLFLALGGSLGALEAKAQDVAPVAQEPAPAAPAPAPATGQELPPPPPPKAAASEKEAPAPPPSIVVATPPPPERELRTFHMHEGFYLRLSVGLGLMSTKVATDRTAYPDYRVGGGGLSLNALVGGSPARGLALGGALLISGSSGSEVQFDKGPSGTATNSSQALLGAFVDGFPQPNGGFHLGGAIGLATNRVELKGEDKPFEGGGLGIAAWTGYGWWVSPEWSMGGLLQLSGSLTRKETDQLTRQATGFTTSLMVTALYH